MAATLSRKAGPGRPKGCLNKRTLEIGGPLDQVKKKVTRTLLDKVAPDQDLVKLFWLCALKAKNDPRYLPAMLAIVERKWGRVKYELEHEVDMRPRVLVIVGGDGRPLDPGYTNARRIGEPNRHLITASAVTLEPELDPKKKPTEE